MPNMPSMSCTGLSINGKPILYYGPETFKITSKAPVKETRTLSNPIFDSFDGNFILKVQNGSHGKTKVEKIEIRIDGILIVSSSDFRKKGNIISKPITLSANSTMEIKLKGDKRSFIVLWIEGTLKEEMMVTDVEGNVYKTVTIGTRVWMAENLKTTKYNDGTGIPLVKDQAVWKDLTTPGYCWYSNDYNTYGSIYGALYNWHAVNTRKLCPAGWNVPSHLEWHQLVLLLDQDAIIADPSRTGLPESLIAGNKLKERGLFHWQYPNMGATNETGFTALPGGARWSDEFSQIGTNGYWWSSTPRDPGPITYVAWSRDMNNADGNILNTHFVPYLGFSVRCLKDE
jgi:uncharacterized protein (TIGR02145 family)